MSARPGIGPVFDDEFWAGVRQRIESLAQLPIRDYLSGGSGPQPIQQGTHICWTYGSDQEHREVLTNFLKGGLERNERVLFLTRRSHDETALAYLRDAGVEVEEYLRSG